MFVNINTINTQDTIRLKNSFLSQTIDNEIPKKTRKRFNPLWLILFFIGIITLFFTHFQITILPKYNSSVNQVSILKNKDISSIVLSDPWDNSRITDNLILLDIPKNTKSGVNINLKSSIDLNESRIILILKNPISALNLEVIARDQNYRSNARDPLRIDINPALNNINYLKVPVHYNQITYPQLNINNINQVRLVFSQNEKSSEPIIINDIILEKKEVH